jgi:hypothetical protein
LELIAENMLDRPALRNRENFASARHVLPHGDDRQLEALAN